MYHGPLTLEDYKIFYLRTLPQTERAYRIDDRNDSEHMFSLTLARQLWVPARIIRDVQAADIES